jgi:peroxiredoxin
MSYEHKAAAPIALIFGLMAFFVGVAPVAANAEDLGPPVGSIAPDIGARLDATGKPRTLADVMGKNGVVLMFFRSADWRPYCQAQLIDVNGGVAEIEKRGYRVAALSYDSPEILQAFTTKRNIAFTFLSDPKSEVIDLYKLRDPQYPPGSRAYGVPRAITFVLDKQGVIKVRPPVTAVISKLDELSEGL